MGRTINSSLAGSSVGLVWMVRARSMELPEKHCDQCKNKRFIPCDRCCSACDNSGKVCTGCGCTSWKKWKDLQIRACSATNPLKRRLGAELNACSGENIPTLTMGILLGVSIVAVLSLFRKRFFSQEANRKLRDSGVSHFDYYDPDEKLSPLEVPSYLI